MTYTEFRAWASRLGIPERQADLARVLDVSQSAVSQMAHAGDVPAYHVRTLRLVEMVQQAGRDPVPSFIGATCPTCPTCKGYGDAAIATARGTWHRSCPNPQCQDGVIPAPATPTQPEDTMTRMTTDRITATRITVTWASHEPFSAHMDAETFADLEALEANYGLSAVEGRGAAITMSDGTTWHATADGQAWRLNDGAPMESEHAKLAGLVDELETVLSAQRDA
jgi:hypothetical protein